MTGHKTRVLFVCIGNSCRSQMAEAFARAYGSDVLVAASAGLGPATRVATDTARAMLEKGIDLRDHFPKSIHHMMHLHFDLVVNMSGYALPDQIEAPTIIWDIADPINLNYDDHCAVRDEIENLVMGLILNLRKERKPTPLRGQGSGRLGL